MTGLATIIDSRPRFEQGQRTLLLQQLDKNQDLSFDLGSPMTSEPSGKIAALFALQVSADLCHRIIGYANSQSLRILRDFSDNGMRTRASGAVVPMSHEGLNDHQHQELRNLGLLVNPATCDADVAHEMEHLLEYDLAAKTEHRSDGAQAHTIEIILDYALATSNTLSEHRSDGEVAVTPNMFEEGMESSHATKWKEASDKETAGLENHEVFH